MGRNTETHITVAIVIMVTVNVGRKKYASVFDAWM